MSFVTVNEEALQVPYFSSLNINCQTNYETMVTPYKIFSHFLHKLRHIKTVPPALRCLKPKQLMFLLLWCNFFVFSANWERAIAATNETKWETFDHWETQLKRFEMKSQFNLNARKFVAFQVFTRNSIRTHFAGLVL